MRVYHSVNKKHTNQEELKNTETLKNTLEHTKLSIIHNQIFFPLLHRALMSVKGFTVLWFHFVAQKTAHPRPQGHTALFPTGLHNRGRHMDDSANVRFYMCTDEYGPEPITDRANHVKAGLP